MISRPWHSVITLLHRYTTVSWITSKAECDSTLSSHITHHTSTSHVTRHTAPPQPHDLYAFKNEAALPVDLELSNWWSCSHPSARFVSSFFVARVVGDER